MNIVPCSIEHINNSASLLTQVYAEPEYKENWKHSDACNYIKRFYEIDPSGCFVAIINYELVGAIFSYSYPWQSETLVYIQELFVSINHRNKGIAKSLLNSVGNGKNVRAWLVANENTSASGFYEKMGFKKDSPYKFNYGTINT